MPAAGFPRTAEVSRHKGRPGRHASKDGRQNHASSVIRDRYKFWGQMPCLRCHDGIPQPPRGRRAEYAQPLIDCAV